MFHGDCETLCGPSACMHMADDNVKTVENGNKTAVCQQAIWSCSNHRALFIDLNDLTISIGRQVFAKVP